jgi:hypothetical protein
MEATNARFTIVFSLISAAILMMTASIAAADPQISVLGGAIQSQAEKTGNGVTTEGQLGLGGGLLIAIPTGYAFGFEVGGLYFNRNFESRGSSLTKTEFDQRSIYLPANFRVGLAKAISLGVGGYYDISLEDGIDDDYGLQGGLRFNIPMSASTALFLDGRYSYGLKDDFTHGRNQDILGMVGFTFNMPPDEKVIPFE